MKRERREGRQCKGGGGGGMVGGFNRTAQPLKEITSDWNQLRPERLGSLLAPRPLGLNNHCLSIVCIAKSIVHSIMSRRQGEGGRSGQFIAGKYFTLKTQQLGAVN